MSALLEDLGAFVATLRGDAIPEPVLRAARIQLVDMVAAVHASVASGAARAVDDAVSAIACAGRATMLSTGAKLAPIDAAYANAAASMAHDFDDVVWMGHTCHSAVFASLAVAEHESASPRALIEAIVLANEIGGRLGASCFFGPLNGQMWTFVHLVSAAAGASRLLGLDAERTTHALAIALAQPPFALQPAFLAPTSKLLSASTPIAIGVRAAYLARSGVTGAKDLLEERRGFFRRFSYLPVPEMLGDLGSFWTTETLQIKTWPGCHYFQTAFDAIAAIRARRPDLDPARVRRVRVDTTKLACEATRFARDYVAKDAIEPVNANFDLALSAAILLHAGRLGVSELEASWLDAHAGAIAALRSRIEVHHDPSLSAKTVSVVGRMPTARRALRRLGLRDVASLVRRYREEYASELASPREVLGALGRIGALVREARAEGEGVRMDFPSRVAIELDDGTREVERVDLPEGSFLGGDVDRALARKVAATVGARRADDVLSAPERARSIDELVAPFVVQR